MDDYVALALCAEQRAKVADSPEIANTWRKIAGAYRLLADLLAKEGRLRKNGKSKDESAGEDDFPRDIW